MERGTSDPPLLGAADAAHGRAAHTPDRGTPYTGRYIVEMEDILRKNIVGEFVGEQEK